MKCRFALLSALLLLVAIRAASASSPETAPVRVRVIAVAPDGSHKEAVEEIKAVQLVGDYSHGAMLGYSFRLRLKSDGRFSCAEWGCLYGGGAAGQWSLDDQGLKLVTQCGDGVFKERPLDRLRVLSFVIGFEKHYMLLWDRHLDWFKQPVPRLPDDEFFLLQQDATREATKNEHIRQIAERAYKAEQKSKK